MVALGQTVCGVPGGSLRLSRGAARAAACEFVSKGGSAARGCRESVCVRVRSHLSVLLLRVVLVDLGFIVVVIAVDRLGTRRRSSKGLTSARSLSTPATLFTFSEAAAPGPVVLFARPGSGSELLSVYRVTEQASTHFGAAVGTW